MKKLIILTFFFIQNISAQTKDMSRFEYQLEKKTAYLLIDSAAKTTIDLSSGNISNENFLLEDGNIYKMKGNDKDLIGKYSNRYITIGDSRYKIRRPVFGKTTLTNLNKNGEVYTLENKRENNTSAIVSDKPFDTIPEAVKLWSLYRAIHRVYDSQEWKQAVAFGALPGAVIGSLSGK